MPKPNPSDSETDMETSSNSEDQSTEKPNKSVANKNTISEYEKQRLSRIADNRAIMETLGLRKMASSLMGSNANVCTGKGKMKKVNASKDEDDDEYTPNDDDDDHDIDDDDDDEDFVASKTGEKRAKNKTPKPKKKASVQKQLAKSEIVDEDKELTQAIALSLQDSTKVPGMTPINEEKRNSSREDLGKKKRKNSQFGSRVKMTEDELIIHFFQFDEAGKGNITARDLERMAMAHDFTWTDKELADMIHCFDSDGDGKLSLDDFRNIASRCNMIQDSGNL